MATTTAVDRAFERVAHELPGWRIDHITTRLVAGPEIGAATEARTEIWLVHPNGPTVSGQGGSIDQAIDVAIGMLRG